MAARIQTTAVATTAKAMVATAPALAAGTFSARPVSQIRCWTPLARWKKTAKDRPNITSLPSGDPIRPMKVP